jgi:hypothetical protein
LQKSVGAVPKRDRWRRDAHETNDAWRIVVAWRQGWLGRTCCQSGGRQTERQDPAGFRPRRRGGPAISPHPCRRHGLLLCRWRVGAHDRSGIAARPAPDRNEQIWRRGERDVFNSRPAQKRFSTKLPLGSLRCNAHRLKVALLHRVGAALSGRRSPSAISSIWRLLQASRSADPHRPSRRA